MCPNEQALQYDNIMFYFQVKNIIRKILLKVNYKRENWTIRITNEGVLHQTNS